MLRSVPKPNGRVFAGEWCAGEIPAIGRPRHPLERLKCPLEFADSGQKPADILTSAKNAIAQNLFALAAWLVVPHIEMAFQASSPKTFKGRFFGTGPFFMPDVGS